MTRLFPFLVVLAVVGVMALYHYFGEVVAGIVAAVMAIFGLETKKDEIKVAVAEDIENIVAEKKQAAQKKVEESVLIREEAQDVAEDITPIKDPPKPGAVRKRFTVR